MYEAPVANVLMGLRNMSLESAPTEEGQLPWD